MNDYDHDAEQRYFDARDDAAFHTDDPSEIKARLIKEFMHNDDEMRELIFDYLDSLLPSLTSLARDFDTDTALSLHKQLVALVVQRVEYEYENS